MVDETSDRINVVGEAIGLDKLEGKGAAQEFKSATSLEHTLAILEMVVFASEPPATESPPPAVPN